MNDTDDIPLRFERHQLPAGEVLLWQGKPHWATLAIDAFHVPWVGIYFLALALWRVAADLHDGATRLGALASAKTLVLPALACMAVLVGLAWLTARATTFTLTDCRLLLRFGVALPALVNIPLDQIEAVKLKASRNGIGDLAISLPEAGRLFYHQLWPYARGGRPYPAVPMLRALPEARRVATLMADALHAATGQPAPTLARPVEELRPAAAANVEPATAVA